MNGYLGGFWVSLIVNNADVNIQAREHLCSYFWSFSQGNARSIFKAFDNTLHICLQEKLCQLPAAASENVGSCSS